MPADTPNYTREAFMAPANLAFLLVALLASVMLSSFIPANVVLLFAAAAELIYLGTVPRNERFRRVVRSRQGAARRTRTSDGDTFRTLDKESQKRYVRFRNMERAIKDNFAKLPYASQGLLDAHLRKLDGLLDAHLGLLRTREGLTRFARRGGEAEIADAIDTLRREMEADPPRVRAIKGQRLAILEKRLDRFKTAGENLDVVDAQLATIEDVTRYVYEQSLTMQNPEEVGFQLDTLIAEVEETQTALGAFDATFADAIGGLDALDVEAFDARRAERAGDLPRDLLDDLDDLTGEASAPRRDRLRE